MRFTVLGSGSTGNATLIEARAHASDAQPTRVLVDCGLTRRTLTQRLAQRGVALNQIDAVFVTHEHSDHVGCLASLMKFHGTSVMTSAGTWAGCARRLLAGMTATDALASVNAHTLAPMDAAVLPPLQHVARAGQPITIGALTLTPFAVPHDATEPLQVVVSDGHRRLGVVTDLGEPNATVTQALSDCDALLLEANHDETMLANGPYPPFLRRRIGGAHGHLANSQSAALLSDCRHRELRRVVAAHLSQHNNTPQLAATALARAMGWLPDQINVADAKTGTPWFEV
jgi:phosphoribosyl 1,2-cyclic phosphodiesterase